MDMQFIEAGEVIIEKEICSFKKASGGVLFRTEEVSTSKENNKMQSEIQGDRIARLHAGSIENTTVVVRERTPTRPETDKNGWGDKGTW